MHTKSELIFEVKIHSPVLLKFHGKYILPFCPSPAYTIPTLCGQCCYLLRIIGHVLLGLVSFVILGMVSNFLANPLLMQ